MNPQGVPQGKARPLLTVRVKLSGFLSSMVPESEFEVEVDPHSTVADVIALLTESLGDAFREAIVDREGRLHGGIVVVLNRRPIPPRQIDKFLIDQKSDLTIIPLVDGG
jgi:sulfur carrier protein ThiS